ncbi:related to integral membrane protein [Cephalotrichum gorgonifer]|uniref:Related to integral membrane protein n=1 Tax=Cephalotrichum gorgonifer TaxID=2041049 RepID=A0AAE8N7P0_9PEZI|nr:related to integral membrane protein [Cephalotrichum gorgonifer]
MEKTVTPEGQGRTTFILTIVMLVVCWPTVIARFMIRLKRSALGLDDWLMGLGLVMTTVWAGTLIVYCVSGGGYNPTDPRLTPALISRALKFYFICQTFYCATTVPIKVSICVALLRISGTNKIFKISLYAIIGISTVAGFGSMIGIAVSCTPPSAFWNPAGGGSCNALVNTFAAYFISACSILTDFGLAILPAFMLWNVQLNRSVKASVAIILGFAAFASCATLVRLKYLLALMNSLNFLQESGYIAVWTVVELAIGIFAGSAPALRPLLRHLPFTSNRETGDPASQGIKGTGGQSHIKMDEFNPGPFDESVRNTKPGSHVIQDGDSQEFIFTDGRRMEIRKDVSVKVETSSEEWDGNHRRYY